MAVDGASENRALYARGAAYGLAAVSIWAAWMPVTRLGVTTHLDAWDLAALRFGTAGLLLAPIVIARGLALERLGWGGLMLLVAGAGAPYALVAASGFVFAPAAHGGVLIPGVMPLFVAALSYAFLGERLSPDRRAGFLLILAGALAIVGPGLVDIGPEIRGHALFLVAALLWACFTVVMRRAQLDPLHAAALVAVGSMIGYIPVYVLAQGGGLSSAPLSTLVAQAIYQGVLATALSLFLYARAVAVLGASGGAAFGALVPALAALFAIPLLGELPGSADLFGILLTSCGVLMASGGLPAARVALGSAVEGIRKFRIWQ